MQFLTMPFTKGQKVSADDSKNRGVMINDIWVHKKQEEMIFLTFFKKSSMTNYVNGKIVHF